MAATSYHVQIINRISSGYPVWYWYLASFAWSDRRMFAVVLRGAVIYGLVQAVLFGSFLPPA
jgi:phosphatidylinositol glycan class V